MGNKRIIATLKIEADDNGAILSIESQKARLFGLLTS